MNGIIAGLSSMLGWGISDFLATKSSRRFGHLMTFFWTQVFGLLFILFYLPIKMPEIELSVIYSNLIYLIPIIIFDFIAYLSFYNGLEKGLLSLVSPISSSWVTITVLLSVIILGETLKVYQLLAIILIIIGILLVSIDSNNLLASVKKMVFVPEARSGLIAMFGWGFGNFLLTPVSQSLGWFWVVVLTRIFMIIFLIFYMLIIKKSFKINVQDSSFPLLLLMSLIDVAAYCLYCIGVSEEYTAIIAPIVASSPLVAVILARIFLKERIRGSQTAGIIVILLGLILIST